MTTERKHHRCLEICIRKIREIRVQKKHGEAQQPKGESVEIGEICGSKTKRTMRLKRQVGEGAHGSHGSAQMAGGMMGKINRVGGKH